MKKRRSKKDKKIRRKQQSHTCSAHIPPFTASVKSEARRNGLTNGERDPLRKDDNRKINPPPIVSGSRKRVRSIVEFVYPKDDTNERRPFLFNPQQTASVGVKRDWQTSQERKIEKKPNSSSESIEEILFSKGKKQLKRESTDGEEDDNRAVEASRQIIENSRDEEMDAGKLSGLSVEDAIRDKAGCRPRANSTDGELNLPRRGLCDERMVLEAHRWKNSFGHTPPKGFANLGNTCFLNATLQCLAYLPTFSQTITSLPNSNSGALNGRKPSKGQRITSMLCSLFRQVHGMNGVKIGAGAISPHAIVTAVPSLGSVGSRCGYKFRPGQQEDAHEFLVHLLDAMQDGELKAAGINQHASGWRDRLPIPRLDETTFINRIFGGYLRSQVQCTHCGFCSNTYDPFLDLSLEVSKKSSSSVASAFAEFTRKEQLDSKNRWKCSGCKKHVCAKKQLTVFRPPLSLCIQLKRFTFGGGFGSGGGGGGWGFGNYTGKGMGMFGRGGSKISKPIEFPSELKLPLSDGRTCEYHLTGVVVHIGGSASSGHYTAFVKKPGSLNRHQWYHMDDSFVEAVPENTVLRQKDAYVLFYCRKEVKIEYPSPPPRGFVSAEAARESGIARARVRSSSLDKGRPVVSKLATTSNASSDKFSSASPPSGSSTFSGSNEKKLSDSINVSLSQASQAPMAKISADFARIKSVESSSSSSDSVASDDEAMSSESEISDGSESKGTKKPEDQNGSSSSGESSSDDSNSGDSQTVSDRNSDKSRKTRVLNEKLQNPVHGDANGETKKTLGTTIVVDHGGSTAKLEVMLGPRKGSKTWKPKALSSTERGSQHELLGSVKVGRWDNDEDKIDDTIPFKSSEAQIEQRSNALRQFDKRERSRKRKMYLDRWDSMLDEGKKKKVKEKKEALQMVVLDPKHNPFHRIQSGMQRMNRGKAKGLHRHSMKKNSNRPHGRRTK